MSPDAKRIFLQLEILFCWLLRKPDWTDDLLDDFAGTEAVLWAEAEQCGVVEEIQAAQRALRSAVRTAEEVK